jgi:acetyl esterase/lipase
LDFASGEDWMNMLHIGAIVLGSLAFGLSLLSVAKLGVRSGNFLLFPKTVSASMALWVAILGLVACMLGLFSGSPLLIGTSLALGGGAAFLSARFIRGVTAPHTEFDTAFGKDWRDHISPVLHARLARRRWSVYTPDAKQPRWERDVSYWTVPGTERSLLCDLWFPLETVPPSRLAVIFVHGGTWGAGDKDTATRPFFRHLCAQGHFVMDVAYRLAHETSMEGMVGDVKRAVAWLKGHASDYGIDPERIVLAGGSAGGHLVLLAGYTTRDPVLTPDDLRDVDLCVRGVISYYGASDLRAVYYDTEWGDLMRPGGFVDMISRSRVLQRLLPGGDSPERMNMANALRALPHLFPGAPDEEPEWFARMSPVEHIHLACPATLLVHGGDDFGNPPARARALVEKLRRASIPAMCVIYPRVDHAFDLILPQWSPAAQASYYDVDHFLALMA